MDSDELFERLRFRGEPRAHPESTVTCDHARFTVLTPRLIRLEWSETGRFDDRSTYAFPTRLARPPTFSQQMLGDALILDTGALMVTYSRLKGKFGRDSLVIELRLPGGPRTWVAGASDPLNLRGTRRTLDACDGDAALEEGLVSRAGWAIFDDSRSVRFDPKDGWVAAPVEHDYQDWYFFGYGHDYKAALADYMRFGHPIPLIPRFALGAWWSRYWAYSAQEFKELIAEFERHGFSLDVLVIDMDWHTPDAWTGYTWNRRLFPDPPGFLRWVHEKGLRTTLNLHPAQGVQSHEEMYPQFARSMGIDPETGQTVAFRIADKRFVKNYFELLHHPREEEGVDFWWVDWQQGQTSDMEGLDPLPWLNHLHFMDSGRRGERPMLYSRWGGLGNHRYAVGFSGDTYATWGSLQFQPFLTATAANVAFGWWSHDIGGHMGGATEPELFARWVQFGALSPILRLHATKDPLAERRPWMYPAPICQAAESAFRLRYQLIPYLYTLARVASDTGIAPCRPMYYEFPEEQSAYVARFQYFLGDQMIAAPIVHPSDRQSGLAATDVWLPEGTWIDYETKESFIGPCWVRILGDLGRVPRLMRAGAILPLAPRPSPSRPGELASGTSESIPKDHLVVACFPGPQGQFRLYEDDGHTMAYAQGDCEWTEFKSRMGDSSTWEVSIEPVEGRCQALPPERSYEVRLEGSHRPERVWLDGVETRGWTYCEDSLTTVVPVPRQNKRRPVSISAFAQHGISALGPAHNRKLVLADLHRLLGEKFPAQTDDETLMEAVYGLVGQAQADAVARLGGPFVRVLEYTTPHEAQICLGRVIVAAPRDSAEPYSAQATFCLMRGGTTERHVVTITDSSECSILDTPFAFGGWLDTAVWSVEIEIGWRGKRWVHRHLSQPLFPTIGAWNVAVAPNAEARLALERVARAPGCPALAPGWSPSIQTVEGLRSLRDSHIVRLPRERVQQPDGSELPTAYLLTCVHSPDPRAVALQFHCTGGVQVFVNGQPIEEAAAAVCRVTGAHMRPTRQTAPVLLRPGCNCLLIRTAPERRSDRAWTFCGALTTPEGDPMTDLSFTLGPQVEASG